MNKKALLRWFFLAKSLLDSFTSNQTASASSAGISTIPLTAFWFLQVNFFCACMMYFGWCSAFRLSPNHSYPRRKTSIQCSGSAPATVSVLLQVLRQVHGFLYLTHRMLYIHFRNRPIQSISQQQSLEDHKRILPLPVVWLIPCGSYGQCLSQPFWAYSQTDTVLSFGSLMVSKSHPPFAMKWKVCIPLSAPYLYGKVWFVAGLKKIFVNMKTAYLHQ